MWVSVGWGCTGFYTNPGYQAGRAGAMTRGTDSRLVFGSGHLRFYAKAGMAARLAGFCYA